jgi:hydrogenase expression/formation protein HypC
MCLAIPGRILSIRGDDPMLRTGRIDFGGAVKDINLVYTPEARPGDYVLVHVGFAMTVIDEAEARRVLETLHEVAGLADASARTAPAGSAA